MAQEIERKFLVANDGWRARSHAPRHIRQGYLSRGPDTIVRIRIFGARAFLTIKSANAGRVRREFEYTIPLADAEELLANACVGGVIEKTRHLIVWDELEWAIDEFAGPLTGLIMAEIELHYADQTIPLPPWAGREVTDDPNYRNDRLSLLSAPP